MITAQLRKTIAIMDNKSLTIIQQFLFIASSYAQYPIRYLNNGLIRSNSLLQTENCIHNTTYSLFFTLAQRPPLNQAMPCSGSSWRGLMVAMPGWNSRCLTSIARATFSSRRANLIPRQALGPWPKAWKACGDLERRKKTQRLNVGNLLIVGL